MLLALLFACSDSREADQLEALTVESDACAASEEACEASGALALASGEGDGDWVVTLGDTTTTLHSSARSDLSALDGLEGTLRLGSVTGMSGARAAALVDADGLAWLGAPDHADALVAELLGEGFARYADEEVARSREGGYILHWHDAVFATDDGDVTASVGVPTSIRVGGATYRAVVVAAYTSEVAPMAVVADCGGYGSMLAFELERVQAADDGEDPVVRPAGKSMAVSGCGG